MKKFDEYEAQKALTSQLPRAEFILSSQDRIEAFLQKLEKRLKLFPKIGKQLSEIPVLISLVKSYVKKEYRDIPVGSVAAIVGSLIYFLAIADLIPDFIPFMGFIDDVGVLAFALKMVDSDIKEYIKWRKETGREIPEQ